MTVLREHLDAGQSTGDPPVLLKLRRHVGVTSQRTARWTLAVAGAVVAAAGLLTAQAPPVLNAELERIFARDEYRVQTVAQPTWIDRGARYAAVEPSASVAGARDIVEYDSATGQRTVLVAASALKPAGAATPLSIDGYA